jgi:hypothetical protein
MSTRYALALLALASLAAAGFGPLTCSRFAARLSGDQEVPPVATRARGEALFLYTDEPQPTALDRIPRKVVLYGLGARGVDRITGADVHCGPAGAKGTVAVPLFGFEGGGTGIAQIRVEGTITDDDVRAVEDSPECPGGIQSLGDLVVKMKMGDAYVNVRSAAHPDGEIRGQIAEAPFGPERKVPCGPDLTCDATTEICVQRSPVGPAITYACDLIPAGCQDDRTCACAGPSLCTGAFGTCEDLPDPDTLACICPQCQ